MSSYIILLSAPYFLVDCGTLLLCFEKSGLTQQFVFHHITVLVLSVGADYTGGFMKQVGTTLFFCELSSLFLGLRYLMFQHGYQQTVLYAINGLLLTFSYFFCRVLLQGFVLKLMWHKYLLNSTLLYPQLITLLYTAFYFLNVYWFQKIFVGMLKVIAKLKLNWSNI